MVEVAKLDIFFVVGHVFRLVPALWAHEPVEAGVVFMPAVGADGGYFVVHFIEIQRFVVTIYRAAIFLVRCYCYRSAASEVAR